MLEVSGDSGITGIGANGVAQFGRDDSLLVEFYRGKRHNGAKSREAGTPIFDPVDMVRIVQPGEKDVMEYEADKGTPPYKFRFPRQWAAYQQGIEQRKAGTPLDLVFPDQPDVVATLNAMHIYNAQQLAGITDTAIGNIPMGRSLVKTAKQFLGQATGSAEFHALKNENVTLSSDLRAALARIEALEEKLTEPKAKADPKKKEAA